MSAPPSGPPSGQGPNPNPNPNQTSNANPVAPPRPPPIRRRLRTADPMVARRRPQPKNNNAARPGAKPTPGASGAARPSQPPARPGPAASSTAASVDPTTSLLSRIAEFRSKTAANGGWSEPLPPGGREWKIVTTKRDLNASLRYHVMRFSSSKLDAEKKAVDPTNQEDFTRPVTLQRRDPRQPAPGREPKGPELPPEPEPTSEDEKEAERIAKLKAEKEAWRAMEAAKSAPAVKDAAPRTKQSKPEDRGVQFHRAPRSEQERKQRELRYEESLPWHIEDADGKNVWVGSYVAPLSETTVCLVATNDGKFAMVPLEKWYKFTAKPNFATMKLEEAEALMKKQAGVSRWYMQDKEKERQQKDMEETRQYFRGPARVKTESSTFREVSREDLFDHDQLDFECDEFQDDDENPGFEPEQDEDQKHASERIRREQLGANLFGDADEGEVDKEELEARLEEEARRREGKEMTKALIKREKETIYKSDSDSGYDPFETSSSEDDSDEEKDKNDKADEDKKDDEKSGSQEPSGLKQDIRGAKDKGVSTPGAKGSLTPSGKHKQTEALKKGKSLKRPGSPDLSESSETEPSRKKKQKKATGTSVQPSRSGTPLPPGVAGQKPRPGLASTSDGEATGGEMSDGQQQRKKQKKIKLVSGGARATPTGSRAGSPSAASPPVSGSRAGSPASAGPIEASELIQALPALPGGITAGELQRIFHGRIGAGPNQTSRADWIQLVKQHGVMGQDRLIRRRE
ncbi:hypothetical protein ACRALDRAFT_2024979 [Sodiomyces alcalophilus JCM 7366]|uniref:uncharacterized protein n=1 Tax=Sodiomyces alcalophilus JCM 7366 TaxID=591952 RepID=UPI0039B45259